MSRDNPTVIQCDVFLQMFIISLNMYNSREQKPESVLLPLRMSKMNFLVFDALFTVAN